MRWTTGAAAALALVVGCAGSPSTAPTAAPPTTTPAAGSAPVTSAGGDVVPARATTTAARMAGTTTTAAAGSPVEIRYRPERRTDDAATAGFTDEVAATLGDARGWGRAGFRFVASGDGPFTIVLAEGPEVDALCLPYDTKTTYSCQNGPVVALNADRWRTATPKWTGDLATYRRYLVGHEVGHLLGLRHPEVQCRRRGEPAPLMNQQSTELDGCTPNPWPLAEEVRLAARRPADLAPPPTPPGPRSRR